MCVLFTVVATHTHTTTTKEKKRSKNEKREPSSKNKTKKTYLTSMSKNDDDDDFLPPPPSDDAPSGAPSFGGWELLALLSLRDGDPKLMKRSIEDPQFNVSDDVFFVLFCCFIFRTIF